jgi:hypothetical protein
MRPDAAVIEAQEDGTVTEAEKDARIIWLEEPVQVLEAHSAGDLKTMAVWRDFIDRVVQDLSVSYPPSQQTIETLIEAARRLPPR